MLQKFSTTVFILAYFVVVIPVFCDSCQNAFETFQEVLQNRQQLGRLRHGRPFPDSLVITTQFVLTKMQCLDICLRTTECASFEAKRMRPDHGELKKWVCVINLQPAVNKSLGLAAQWKGWIHVNVSSQELQEMLSSATQACQRRENPGTVSTNPHPDDDDSFQETMDKYCADKELESCEEEKENSCEGVWKARRVSENPTDGWCCFNSHDKDNKCLHRITLP